MKERKYHKAPVNVVDCVDRTQKWFKILTLLDLWAFNYVLIIFDYSLKMVNLTEISNFEFCNLSMEHPKHSSS